MMQFLSAQLLSWISLVTAVDSQCTICDTCINKASRAEYEAMKICFYTGLEVKVNTIHTLQMSIMKNGLLGGCCDGTFLTHSRPTVDDFTCVPIGDVSVLLPMMDSRLPTTWYCAGWLSSPNGDVVRTVISALLARRDRNVLFFDWSNIAVGEYTRVARSVPGVGVYLANAIAVLRAGGLNTNGLKLVGHSLGAHVWGWAGKCGNWRLPMIIGLDPAAPMFTSANSLNSTDAEVVHNIHSNAGGFGTKLQSGSADFYPNGGSLQPVCSPLESLFCNHNMSALMYAASVGNENLFPARKCDSYFDFQNGLCNFGAIAMMGDEAPTDARGRYFLDTAIEPPYGLGQSGAGYYKDERSNFY